MHPSLRANQRSFLSPEVGPHAASAATARPKPIICTAITRANANAPKTRIMIAAALGAHVVGVDIREDKLRFAESIGAAATVNAGQVADKASSQENGQGTQPR